MTTQFTITPHLWFDDNAEEAVNFYVSIFNDSRITAVSRYGDAGPGAAGKVMSIAFRLNGQDFTAINGGPHFKFNESVSFLLGCETQEAIDTLYARLVEGGVPSQCGWLKDRFGLSWQVNYAGLSELMSGKDPAASARAMQAMLKMKKIDIEALKLAYAGA
jgi:predicted 3-demethylubiquinone-9 3-methyltransferase (glyoxalase superfamily)